MHPLKNYKNLSCPRSSPGQKSTWTNVHITFTTKFKNNLLKQPFVGSLKASDTEEKDVKNYMLCFEKLEFLFKP